MDPKYPNYINLERPNVCLEAKIIGVNMTETTKYGLESIKYLAAKVWNLLTDDLRTIMDINKFKTAIRTLDFSIPF